MIRDHFVVRPASPVRPLRCKIGFACKTILVLALCSLFFVPSSFAQSNLTYELKVGSTGENGLLAAFPESYAGEKVNIRIQISDFYSLIILFEVGHLDGGDGTFYSLVTQTSAATVERLLTVVDGKHGEDDRHMCRITMRPCLQTGIEQRNALRDRLAYVVEMRRIAPDNATDNDDSRKTVAGESVVLANESRRRIGELHRTGYVLDDDILLIHTVFLQRIHSSTGHGVGDFRVPIRYYNSIALTSENISARQNRGIVF